MSEPQMYEQIVDKYKTLRDLQTEKEQLNNLVNVCQEEIRKLKEENEMLKDAQNNLEKQILKEMNYKTRCDKAVEYIENAQERDEDEESCSLHVPTLKSILNGRSDE